MVLPIGVILSKVKGSYLIYDAHELESDKSGQSKLLSSITLFFEKISWNSIDVLITVSPAIEKWYSEYLGSKKSEIIYNSPEFKIRPYSEKFSLRKKLNIKSKYIFVYVGNLAKGRFIEQILRVFNNSKIASSLILIGEGELENEIRKLKNFEVNIFLHPFVEHHTLIHYLKDCDFGFCIIEDISLSDRLCLPNKLFEYAFSGLKIIASDIVEVQKVVTKYNLGYTIKADQVSLVEVLKMVEKENSDKIIETINSEFIKSYSWESQENKLFNLYKELCVEFLA